MSTDALAIIGFVSLFVLMLLRVPVGMAMGLVGVTGFGYMVGGGPALKMVGQTSMRTVTDFNFAVVPMFLLMGVVRHDLRHEPRTVPRRQRLPGPSARRAWHRHHRGAAAALRRSAARRSRPRQRSRASPIRKCAASTIRSRSQPA